jgi:hypothetical protein
MTKVRFEPNNPVFERAKTVHVLHSAATVIGYECNYMITNNRNRANDDSCSTGGGALKNLDTHEYNFRMPMCEERLRQPRALWYGLHFSNPAFVITIIIIELNCYHHHHHHHH